MDSEPSPNDFDNRSTKIPAPSLSDSSFEEDHELITSGTILPSTMIAMAAGLMGEVEDEFVDFLMWEAKASARDLASRVEVEEAIEWS